MPILLASSPILRVGKPVPNKDHIESANGKFSSMNGAPGDVFWTDGYVKHRGLNIRNRASDMVIVELK